MRTRVKVQVPGMQPYITCGATACDIVFQVLTIQPGGFTGWHTQPGPTFVAVAGGRRVDVPGGRKRVHTHQVRARGGFLQPSTEVHNMRNEASAPLVLHAFYFLHTGSANTAIRVDQSQPSDLPGIP